MRNRPQCAHNPHVLVGDEPLQAPGDPQHAYPCREPEQRDDLDAQEALEERFVSPIDSLGSKDEGKDGVDPHERKACLNSLVCPRASEPSPQVNSAQRIIFLMPIKANSYS